MSKGKIIVCSGGEGSGKSTTIARLLQEYPELKSFAFPGGNEFGQLVRSIVKQGLYGLPPRALMTLIWTNFTDMFEREILPELNNGQNFIFDRLTPDNYGYQSHWYFYGPQEFFMVMERIGVPAIDLWLWFDVHPPVGLARRQQDGNVDVFDAKELEFHYRVRQALMYVNSADIPQIKHKVRIDANQDLESVYQDVKRQLLPFLQP